MNKFKFKFLFSKYSWILCIFVIGGYIMYSKNWNISEFFDESMDILKGDYLKVKNILSSPLFLMLMIAGVGVEWFLKTKKGDKFKTKMNNNFNAGKEIPLDFLVKLSAIILITVTLLIMLF